MVVHPASNRLVVIGSDHGALPLSKASESSEDAMDVDGSGNTLALLSSSSLVDKPEQKNDKSKADENEEREEDDEDENVEYENYEVELKGEDGKWRSCLQLIDPVLVFLHFCSCAGCSCLLWFCAQRNVSRNPHWN